jgi:peptide/nickel transport system substrate-binding protein
MLRAGLYAALLGAASAASAAAAPYVETPILKIDVVAGKLPPVAERLPKNPLVVKLEG